MTNTASYRDFIIEKQTNLKLFLQKVEYKTEEANELITKVVSMCDSKPEELVLLVKSAFKDCTVEQWVERTIGEMDIKENIEKEKQVLIRYLNCFKEIVKKL